MTFIYAVIIFCILIFVHEFGHFAAAKACNIKVNEFAIGMGPGLLKKQRGETLYSVRLFPIGGYCAMEGEDEDSEDERAFNNKPAWQRAIVLAAGAFMNFITVVLLLIIISLILGQATTTIDKIADDSPALRGGMKKGDVIVAVNTKQVKDWNDVIEEIGKSDSEELNLIVDRNGKKKTLSMESEYDKKLKRKKIGISPLMEHNFFDAIYDGIKSTGRMTVMMYDILKQLFQGDVSIKELSGPVGIVYAVSESAKAGVIYVVYLAALLSLNLAIINMLPFPALDGGRLLFLAIAKLTGKRITAEIEGRIHFIGIVLLLILMVYITWNDIIKFVVP